MRFWIHIGLLFPLLLLSGRGFGQTSPEGPPDLDPDANYRVRTLYFTEFEIDENGDSVACFQMTPVPVFSRVLIDWNKHRRLIRNLKVVYPIAKFANDKLREMEVELEKIPNKRDQEKYVKAVEKELKQQYTPILKKMSFSQGKILIKLIDRETGRTSFQLVKDMRGNFSAFFWQNLGRIFGMNLKDTYDPEGEDKVLEQLIHLYEAGLL